MIFDWPIFQQMILPFVLVFVLLFAILQKTKILGDEAKQANALVSLAMALILIAFETPRNIIVNLVPWLAVGVVVILVFFLLYGFVASNSKDGMKIENWMKWVLAGLAAIFVIGVVLAVTGVWDLFIDWAYSGGSSGEWITNILIIIIVVGALAVVVGGKGGKDKDKD